MRWAIPFIFSFILLNSQAHAQNIPGPETGPNPRVYLITIGPGAESYEKFGHNMIWIHDPAHGFEPAYNWGMFDFNQENFTWRFIQGRMEYWMDAWDAPAAIAQYQKDNRSIWIQELNLSDGQIELLLMRLQINRLPKNKNYKYDYYLDNCSTRARDALDGVLMGQIKTQMQNVPTNTTFRWHTRRLTQDDWWLYVALNYVMGHPIDQPISAWEECFLPVKLMEHLRSIQVMSDAGKVPLVHREWQIYQSTQYLERPAPPKHWIWTFAAFGIVLGALMALLGRANSRIAKFPFGAIALAWSILGGLAGAISTWGWFFTDHRVARYNENWLQLNPILLGLIIFVPAMLQGKKWAVQKSRRIAMAAAILSILGLILKILPFMYQVNGEIIALALPANIGLALGVMAASKPRYSNTQSGSSAELK